MKNKYNLSEIKKRIINSKLIKFSRDFPRIEEFLFQDTKK